MTYEEQQLQRLKISEVYSMNVCVYDSEGNKTNFMGLNEDLIKALRVIELQQRKKQKRYKALKQTYDLSQAITAFNNGHKVYVLDFDGDLSTNEEDTLMMDITQIQDAEGHLFGWEEAQQ